MTGEEESALRRQQLETHHRVEQINRDNQWMLIPIFAPEIAIAGFEAGGFLLGRAAAKRLAKTKPLEWGPQPRNGDTLWTQRGRRAHKAFQSRVEQKPGWSPERNVIGKNGEIIRPDARTPTRPSAPERRFNVELKPNTPSGRRAGARSIERYKAATDQRGRVIYYDPKDYR